MPKVSAGRSVVLTSRGQKSQFGAMACLTDLFANWISLLMLLIRILDQITVSPYQRSTEEEILALKSDVLSHPYIQMHQMRQSLIHAAIVDLNFFSLIPYRESMFMVFVVPLWSNCNKPMFLMSFNIKKTVNLPPWLVMVSCSGR